MSRFPLVLMIVLSVHCIVTIGLSAWYYKEADISSTKDNTLVYYFGSPLEKMVSAFEASIAFDSILFVWSIASIIIFKKNLTKPTSIIISIFFLLFFWGKAMGGSYYLIDPETKIVHDNNKDAIQLLKDNNIDIPDILNAWQTSYYAIISSLLGYALWIFLINIFVIKEAKNRADEIGVK